MFVSSSTSQATAEANNLAAVAAAKDLYNKKMEEVSATFLSLLFFLSRDWQKLTVEFKFAFF